jgi:hypothetical protein
MKLQIPQEIIDAAPNEPEEITKMRNPRLPKLGVTNVKDEARLRKWEANAVDMGIKLEKSGFDKITLQLGPTRFTVWNTKQNLEALNKRLKKLR